MTTSPGQPPRDQAAPPRESAGRLHRGGYLALAASGLALCTAFAAVAQIMQPELTEDTRTTQTGRSTGSDVQRELVPGQAVPAEATVVINGVAITGEMPSSSSSPTTIITTDEDGNRRTTVHTPPRQEPTHGAPGDGDDGSGQQPSTQPTDTQPGPQPPESPGNGDGGNGDDNDDGDDGGNDNDGGDGGNDDGDDGGSESPQPPSSSPSPSTGGSSVSAGPSSAYSSSRTDTAPGSTSPTVSETATPTS